MQINEYHVTYDGWDIYGKLYLPETKKEKYPLVIVSHGFRADHKWAEPEAQALVKAGYMVYIFDFDGIGKTVDKDGKTDFLSMSVLTEARDLNAIIDHFKNLPEVDGNRLYLVGQSQGGFVSAYVAGKRPTDIAGLVLLYPALVLQDDAKKRVQEFGESPEATNVMGTKIGEIYNKDALSFDIYDIIPAYENPVLIVHGDKDPIAPLSYSEKAKKIYANAELVVIQGAKHGFKDQDLEASNQAILAYLAKREDALSKVK